MVKIALPILVPQRFLKGNRSLRVFLNTLSSLTHHPSLLKPDILVIILLRKREEVSEGDKIKEEIRNYREQLADTVIIFEAEYRRKILLPIVLLKVIERFQAKYFYLIEDCDALFFDLIILEESKIWRRILISLFKGILGKILKFPQILGAVVIVNPKKSIHNLNP